MGLVSVLLALSLVAPLWSTRMEAPQYRGDEALSVSVYAGRVTGDVGEIETLNQYVGVHLPLDAPELRASSWALGAVWMLALLALTVPSRQRTKVVAILFVALLLGAAAGGSLLQYRLYQMGHVRGDAILEGVPNFTPPVLGTTQIANFTATMSLGLGGWAYLAALVLTGWAIFGPRRQQETRALICAPQESVLSTAAGPHATPLLSAPSLHARELPRADGSPSGDSAPAGGLRTPPRRLTP
jgi:hypothetical protein